MLEQRLAWRSTAAFARRELVERSRRTTARRRLCVAALEALDRRQAVDVSFFRSLINFDFLRDFY